MAGTVEGKGWCARVEAVAGADVIVGVRGAEVLPGGARATTLNGGDGADRLVAQADDALCADAGADVLDVREPTAALACVRHFGPDAVLSPDGAGETVWLVATSGAHLSAADFN